MLLRHLVSVFVSCFLTSTELPRTSLNMNLKTLDVAAMLMLAVVLAGCGSEGPEVPAEMGKVKGTVLVNGRPVENIKVIFDPVEGGGQYRADTDKEGKYELEYGGGGLKGAVLGQHRVAFEHYAEDIVDGEPLPGGEPAIADKYFPANSDITREVKAGEQQIDFELDGPSS